MHKRSTQVQSRDKAKETDKPIIDCFNLWEFKEVYQSEQ